MSNPTNVVMPKCTINYLQAVRESKQNTHTSKIKEGTLPHYPIYKIATQRQQNVIAR